MNHKAKRTNKYIAWALLLVLSFYASATGQISYAYNGVDAWFESGIAEAGVWRIIPDNFEKLAFDQPITRGEFAEVVVLAYVSAKGSLPDHWDDHAFVDQTNAYAKMAHELQLLSGYPDGTFGPGKQIKREEMFVMLHKLASKLQTVETIPSTAIDSLIMRFADAAEVSTWAREATAFVVSKSIVAGTDLGTLEPMQSTTRAQSLVIAKNTLKMAASQPVSQQTMDNVLYEIKRQIYKDSYSAPTTNYVVSRGGTRTTTSPETAYTTAQLMVMLGSNSVKYASIFGSADAVRYQTAEEAKLHMVTISFDVWQLGTSGVKTVGKRTLVVHTAIADTLRNVFKEIFEGAEQFPIKDVGGYAWRTSTTSEHRWGLAVDINANENYMINSAGAIVAGSFWKPGVSPFSIKPDGDVVSAFKKYGFSWGGDAWPSNHDYMHFSFLGK